MKFIVRVIKGGETEIRLTGNNTESRFTKTFFRKNFEYRIRYIVTKNKKYFFIIGLVN